jgi:hypothetical protein
VAKVSGLAVATVMAVSPTSCQSLANSTDASSVDESQLVIKADKDACWSITIDGDSHEGCGTKTFYLSGTSHNARLVKTTSVGTINVMMIANGRTIDSGSVRTSGHYVTVN